MAIFGWINDILHSQKDEFSLNKHMGLTVYTKWNLFLLLCVDDPAVMRTKVEKPILGPKWLFLWLLHPYTFLTPIEPYILCGPCRCRYNVEPHNLYFLVYVYCYGALRPLSACQHTILRCFVL
jgi:hypothetical protein